jgi:hypothetical protein
MYLVDLYHISVDCLEVVCKPRLIFTGSHYAVVSSTFDSRSCLFDSDGPVNYDSRSGVSV